MDDADVERIELGLIAQDCSDLVRLVMSLSQPEIAGAVSLGIAPFVGFVADESLRYLSPRSNSVDARLFRDISCSVTKLRARVKLFDDDPQGLRGLVDTLAIAHSITAYSVHRSRSGILGGLKRALQPDLGIFWHEEMAVANTHAAMITLGLTHEQIRALKAESTQDQIAEFAKRFSLVAGEYIGQLSTLLGQSGCDVDTHPALIRPEDLAVTHTDHFGDRAYALIARELQLARPELSAALLFVATQTNFVEHLLAALLPSDSTLLLRARFLTAYHGTTVLGLLAELERDAGGTRLVDLVNEIHGSSDSEFLLHARELRDLLAHYALRGSAPLIVSESRVLDQVARAQGGIGVADLSEIARRQLAAVSDAFAFGLSKSALRDSRAWLGANN